MTDYKQRWKVKSGKQYELNTRDKKELVKAIGKQALARELKEFRALTLKEAFDEAENIKTEIMQSVKDSDMVKVQDQYAMTSSMLQTAQMKILTKMIEHEEALKKPHSATMKWIFNAINEMRKVDSEIRKANEGKFKMVVGEKKININVDAKKMTMEEFTGMKPKTILEAEGEVVQDTEGQKDTTVG